MLKEVFRAIIQSLFIRSEEGGTHLEYALMVALATAMIVGGFTLMGRLNNALIDVVNQLRVP